MKRFPVPEGYQLPESAEALLGECDVSAFRATGPGGQGVNTTDSAVRLKHRPTGIVVVCRRERSQLRNKETCLKRLRERIEESMAPPPPPRKATRPSRGAKERRLAEKSLRSSTKATRKRPGHEE
ncbi:MAG: peptide chain release factor-like protein [Actinobacteria bacterium HGW-Actinobacteria-7]|nr:MAG: peptide chain release factor-like protein [Actinobacteria bacterium HGW-Actinobacteria-7]